YPPRRASSKERTRPGSAMGGRRAALGIVGAPRATTRRPAMSRPDEWLEPSAAYGYEALPRESGGTGRRAGFRILWAKHPWGFKSPLSHFVTVRSPSGSSIQRAVVAVVIGSVVP